MTGLTLPPLFTAEASGEPFADACARAGAGCDAGLVLHDLALERLRAALVLAPDVPLARAMTMLPLCAVGFQNALGALAPPEVSVHLDWDGGLRVNGGRAGALRIAAATRDPDAVPDWLVIGLTLDLWPGPHEGGETPDTTALYAEGCVDVAPDILIEAWIRHTLVWLNRWEDEGNAPLHREWAGFAHVIGAGIDVAGEHGTFTGLDENFALLLKQGDATRAIPLGALLTDPKDPT
ncbi:biotin/lipoate--protein ligase family protein [Oceaniglobus indicus]|uniref:biotin/lipoate--protein ligase family protein n=1 Tax=Oceaniglobus indicus TaxID=2047749 RepID=UPI000C18ED85|nr:biotin/lipoate--protein ligase family protein [Oceaniglobus indicus]